MADLATLQQRVAEALTGRANSDVALPLIAGDPTHARERLAIYRANIAANATRALASIYPIVRKLVGAEFFDGLAQAYAEAHPSVSGDLNEFGATLADFVATFPPAHSLPYLPDVARLEWLAHRAHYAADHVPLDFGALASITTADYARLTVTLHPAVATLASSYPLYRIWEVHQDDYRGEIAVDLGSGAGDVVVYRDEYRVTVAKLSRGEAVFLRAVGTAELLGAALERALAEDPGFDLAASLQRWSIAQIVVGLYARN
jgi:hypothetical protein